MAIRDLRDMPVDSVMHRFFDSVSKRQRKNLITDRKLLPKFYQKSAKELLLLANLSLLIVISIGGRVARAEPAACINHLNSNPPIGSLCFVEARYDGDIENTKDVRSIEVPVAAQQGFVIVDTQIIPEGRGGNTIGPEVVITRPGTALTVLKGYQQSYQEYNEFVQKTKANVEIKGVNFGGMSDLQQKANEQFASAINQLTQIQSNSEAIVVRGSIQAVWETWLGQTVYKKGGHLHGRVIVYQRYIGTPQQASQLLTNSKAQILALVGNQTPTPPPTPIPANPNPAQILRFGAIARSDSTGKLGYAWGFDNSQAAENGAIRECGSSDCKSNWFSNAFGALAKAEDNAWASSWGNTKEEAEQNSLQSCQKNSSQPITCKVILVIDSKTGVILQQ
jgi:hypothetical protein